MILARCVFVFKHLNFPTEVFLQYVCPCSFYLRTMRISGVVHPHDNLGVPCRVFFLDESRGCFFAISGSPACPEYNQSSVLSRFLCSFWNRAAREMC